VNPHGSGHSRAAFRPPPPGTVREVVIRAVIFDWRGTLATTLTGHEWVGEALRSLGRPAQPTDVWSVVEAISAADGPENRLDGAGVDSDADLHRRTFLSVFADAGLDDDLAQALYAIESDVRYSPFADDVADTLIELHRRGIRLAVVSDIHVDLRPAFDAAGLAGLIDVFTLSYEHGIQKPDPAMFRRTLGALAVGPDEALMVGDRARPDGAAVELGITTLLLPPLRGVADRRLDKVLALCP